MRKSKKIMASSNFPKCLRKQNSIISTILVKDDGIFTNDRVVPIGCRVHGTFLMTVKDHIDKVMGCPDCDAMKNKSMDATEFAEKMNKVHSEKYIFDKATYVNNNTPVTIICLLHGDFQKLPAVELDLFTCPACNYDCRRCIGMPLKPTNELDSIPPNIKIKSCIKAKTEKLRRKSRLNQTLDKSNGLKIKHLIKSCNDDTLKIINSLLTKSVNDNIDICYDDIVTAVKQQYIESKLIPLTNCINLLYDLINRRDNWM